MCLAACEGPRRAAPEIQNTHNAPESKLAAESQAGRICNGSTGHKMQLGNKGEWARQARKAASMGADKPPGWLTQQLRAADCHQRSSGVIIVDQLDNIVFADSEAIDVLRGPAEEWSDDSFLPLRDNSYAGCLHEYWRFIEYLTVSDNDCTSGNGYAANTEDSSAIADSHHYLVVERAEDHVVIWMQVCVHFSPSEDGKALYVWSVRDISGPARCLEMSRMATVEDYTLSLEDDGFPYTPLLTHAPTSCHPSNRQARAEMAALLEAAAVSERFAVLHLTGFGAVDAVFPRRMLGWSEACLLDRSFIGLLSPEDRIFFCRALRRCYHDGIPQRLVLKIASAPLSSLTASKVDMDEAAATLALVTGGEEHAHLPEAHIYIDCDVTVLMPEAAVQQPVLVVRANDPCRQAAPTQPLVDASAADCPLSAAMCQPLFYTRACRQFVRRVQLDFSGVENAGTASAVAVPLPPPPAHAFPADLVASQLLKGADDMSPHSSPPSPSLSTTSSSQGLSSPLEPTTSWSQYCSKPSAKCIAPESKVLLGEPDALSRASTCIDDIVSTTEPPDQQMFSRRMAVCANIDIPMVDVFAHIPTQNLKQTAAATKSYICGPDQARVSEPGVVDGVFTSALERLSLGAIIPSTSFRAHADGDVPRANEQ
ncbi:hypothetical protein GGI04_000213 [Coemansia thaxteri]|nr:hypothetical protein GGI04_000213 [Coemansia thaxteri]